MLDLNSLNPPQRRAVETLRGPVLILAGAGTGKTRVITYRLALMIERGIPAENILAVTFTNKAAREMKERVSSLLPRRSRAAGAQKPPGPTISTFHSLGVRILRAHIEALGYKRNFVIYDDSEQLGAIKKILGRLSAKGENLDPQAIMARISRLKSAKQAGPAAGAESSESAIARHILPQYEQTLRASNAVDFDDLLLLPLKLLLKHPNVLALCRDKFRYVMVDEYQDTNAAQFQLLQLLCQDHRNLCVVGDDDQSIYGWRGAEIANLLDLEQHFSEVQVIKLEQNYRSTNLILQAANAVIKNNVRRRAKQLWSGRGLGEKITLHTFKSDDEEARLVVEEIECARLMRRIPWKDQAILFRTNQQSRPIETALRKARVRYHLVGGQSYFDRREVRDLLAYLKTFVNPNDDVSLLRIVNVPARGLSPAVMEQLLAASQERHCSVYAAMKHTDVQAGLGARARPALLAFLDLLERVRAVLVSEEKLALQSWLERFLTEIGYIEDLRRSEKTAEGAESRLRNLKDLLVELDKQPGLHANERLENFLEQIALDRDREEESEPQGDAVTLITMHSCKGLEFPHVYVVGMEDGLLPHSRSKEEGTLDEERRLFYVAITRAMRTLTLSYCLERRKYGAMIHCHPSPFLKELPQELVEHASQRARTPVPVDLGKGIFASMHASLE